MLIYDSSDSKARWKRRQIYFIDIGIIFLYRYIEGQWKQYWADNCQTKESACIHNDCYTKSSRASTRSNLIYDSFKQNDNETSDWKWFSCLSSVESSSTKFYSNLCIFLYIGMMFNHYFHHFIYNYYLWARQDIVITFGNAVSKFSDRALTWIHASKVEENNNFHASWINEYVLWKYNKIIYYTEYFFRLVWYAMHVVHILSNSSYIGT